MTMVLVTGRDPEGGHARIRGWSDGRRGFGCEMGLQAGPQRAGEAPPHGRAGVTWGFWKHDRWTSPLARGDVISPQGSSTNAARSLFSPGCHPRPAGRPRPFDTRTLPGPPPHANMHLRLHRDLHCHDQRRQRHTSTALCPGTWRPGPQSLWGHGVPHPVPYKLPALTGKMSWGGGGEPVTPWFVAPCHLLWKDCPPRPTWKKASSEVDSRRLSLRIKQGLKACSRVCPRG